jgi:hypothetical protein
MGDYDVSTYGDRVADVYDRMLPVRMPHVAATTEIAVAALAELAGSGPVLELGIGTGWLFGDCAPERFPAYAILPLENPDGHEAAHFLDGLGFAPDVQCGDFVLPRVSLRDDGTTARYVPRTTSRPPIREGARASARWPRPPASVSTSVPCGAPTP